jgi:hypothetical protein
MLIIKIIGLILFLLLYILPLVFQYIFGNRAVEGKSKFKFYEICIISILLLLTSFGIHYWGATKVSDGLASLAIVMLNVFMALLTVIVMLVQFIFKIIKYRK